MPLSGTDILCGMVIPILVAATTNIGLRRALPKDVGDRYATSLAVFIAFVAGYGLLALAPWSPTAHWHWFLYMLFVAACVGPVVQATGVRAGEQWMVFAVTAIGAGWFLVPDWADLEPSRSTHLLAFAAYVVLLAAGLEGLALRLPGPLLPAVLGLSLLVTGVVLALSGSLRFAQLAFAAATAFLGISIVARSRREENMLQGSGLLFAFMAVGAMLIGRVQSFSEVPLISYVLVPMAPLALWGTTMAPIATLSRRKATMARLLAPALFFAVSLAFAVIAERGAGNEY